MGNKGARGSGPGGGSNGASGNNGNSSASSAAQHGRRGSVSSTSASNPHGHAHFDLHGPMSSPHTYPLSTLLAGDGKPPDRDKDKKHAKPWHRWERDMLKSTFSDLAARSTHHSSLSSQKHKRTGIDKETFLKFFCNVPGVLGERLFLVFNKSASGLLDLDEFLSGLASYCRGSMEQKVAFLFAMCNLAGNGRVSRVELETMCNSILFAEESLRRHQSAAAAHAVAAEASVALAAQAAASSHDNRAAGGPQAALLHEHLRQMKSRAHSPSFQYSPDAADAEATFAHEIARATALNAAEAAAAQEEKKDPAKTAAGTSEAAGTAKSAETRHDGQPDAYAAASVATPSSAAPSAAAAAPLSALLEEPLSPLFIEADDNLVHARRVKEMVDDAFAIATPAPASAATAESVAASSSSLLAPPGASTATSVSARPSLSGPDVSSGLSVYHFGRWLQNHPEILDVLDAAFVGKEGLSYLNLNYNQQQQGNGVGAAGGDDAASLEQLSNGAAAQQGSLSHRGSAADVLSLDASAANGVGGAGSVGGGGSRFPPPSLGLPGHSDGSLAPSPLAVPAGSPAAGGGGDGGFSLASSKSEDKKTWKNGPRLSISSAPTGVQPGSARAGSAGTLMGGNRSASQSHSSAAQQQFHRLGSYPGASATLTAPAAAAMAAALAASSSVFHLHCDHCGFDITARYCMACGKLLHPTATTGSHALAQASASPNPHLASAAAQPSTPAASPTTAAAAAHEYSCSHCNVPMFGCGAPRFCLCCGADTRSAAVLLPSGALSTTAASAASAGSASKPSWPLAPRLPVSAPAASHAVEGYLKKVGARLKTIIRRWYVIRDNFMYTYPSARDLKPSHVLFLEGCFVEPVNHEDRNAKLKFGIEIILSEASSNGPRQSRVLYASSAESRQQWLDSIRVHANVHDISEFYELGPELGVGRFSSVREGLSKFSGKRYAIKVIDKSDLSDREREALRTEVAVLKLVHHPNIIHLKNVFETRKQIFIVMTFVRGGDLFERLVKRKRFPESTVQAIMLQLFQVVQYLHVRGIVHRDLKPENIMMQKESESDPVPASGTDGSAAASGAGVSAPVADADDTAIMLADFGLGAFALPDQSMKLPCGTLTFTAPEVLIGKGYGMEVDLWSLGVIFFLLIRGRLPFDGKSPDEIREKTIKGLYVIDSHPSWAEASADCKDLIRALLKVDPAQRINCNQALEHAFFKIKFNKPNANAAAPGAAAAATNTAAATDGAASAAAPPAAPASDAATPAHLAASGAAPSAALRSHLSPGSSLRILAASPSPSPSFPAASADGASASAASADTPSMSTGGIGGGSGGASMSPATAGSAITPVTASSMIVSTPQPQRGAQTHSLISAHSSVTLPALLVPSSEATSPTGVGAGAAGAGPLNLTAEEGLVLHRSLSLSSLDGRLPDGSAGVAAGACASPGVDDDDSAESNVIRFEDDPEGAQGSPSSALSPITILPYPTPAAGEAGAASGAASASAAMPVPSSAFNSDTDDHDPTHDLSGADSDGAGGGDSMGMARPPSLHLLSRFLSPPSTFAHLHAADAQHDHSRDNNARDSDDEEDTHDRFRRATHEHRQA